MRAATAQGLMPVILTILGSMCASCVGVAGSSHAQLESRTATCNQSWSTLEDRLKENYPALKGEWTKLQGQCAGTGIYELHEGLLLQHTGEVHQAVEYFDAALKRHLPDEQPMRMYYWDALFSDVLATHPQDTEQLKKINQEFERLARNDSENTYTLTELARQRVTLHDDSAAVYPAQKAADLDPDSWTARYWLLLAASRAHQCALAEPYILSAVKTHDFLLEQPDFMYAAVSCYLEVGEPVTAQKALGSLVKKKPAVVSDPTFQSLYTQVTAAVAAARAAHHHSAAASSEESQ
jgi:tetratricopeptide (TPR) repeat protein